MLLFSNRGKSLAKPQIAQSDTLGTLKEYFAKGLLAISSTRRKLVRASALLVSMAACSTALQAAPISLNLGSVGDPATTWDASANVNVIQWGTNTGLRGFNCVFTPNCSGTLSQTFNLATPSLFNLAFNYGFGESIGPFDEPIQIRALVDATEMFRALVTHFTFGNPITANSNLVPALTGDLSLSAGLHTLSFEFSRLAAPGFLRGPYFIVGGVSERIQANDPPPVNGVPEPGSVSLLLAGLGMMVWRKKNRLATAQPTTA